MDGLVNDLRVMSAVTTGDLPHLLKRAADEIDRLRAEATNLAQANDECVGIVARQTEDLIRLRAARPSEEEVREKIEEIVEWVCAKDFKLFHSEILEEFARRMGLLAEGKVKE